MTGKIELTELTANELVEVNAGDSFAKRAGYIVGYAFKQNLDVVKFVINHVVN